MEVRKGLNMNVFLFNWAENPQGEGLFQVVFFGWRISIPQGANDWV
jgi:hypothetical protein